MFVSFATAVLLAQGASVAAEPAHHPIDLEALEACSDSLDVAIFNAPRRPWKGTPLRLLISSGHDLGPARIVALDPGGAQTELPSKRYGAPPWGWIAEVDAPSHGRWRFALQTARGVAACQDVYVRHGRTGSNELAAGDPVWEDRIKWERDTENLYSLWIEALFDAPLDEELSWPRLADALADRERNVLYDYMGLEEDRDGLGLEPDCADFPYFLRGYFAWKLGLPFSFRPCRRGNAERAPTCSADDVTNLAPAEVDGRVEAFKRFMRRVMNTVHSSSLRTVPEDERSDLYPVALTREALRPGTTYSDPYGHTMVIARWFPQDDGDSGVLMSADAQPDGTVGRRVFWRGSFMFTDDGKVPGAGWKRFRPVRRVDDELVPLSNDEIAESVDYGDFSVEQWEAGKEAFYERMDALINPEPRSPEQVLLGLIDALGQQVRRRVESVDNAERWMAERPGRTMKMPNGGAIFLTSGPWEDYSTPSRDMRLLIAIDTVAHFPARVAAHPERFTLGDGADPASEAAKLEQRLKDAAGERTFSYTRSDGSAWTLSLYDVIARAEALEMAYNPNDCVEIRWAAPEGSDERSPCERHAPEAHREKMRSYRPWFERRERPIY